MRTRHPIYRLALALGLSIGALTAAVVIQGTLLFPDHFQKLHDPVQTSIRQISLVADGTRAIALLRHSPRALPHEPQCTLYLCELAESSHSSHSLDVGCIPWIVAGARGADHVFVGSRDGNLYCFDSTASSSKPRLLGKHAEGQPLVLECSRDGLMVIAGNVGHTSAWSSETPSCLWQRSDIDMSCAHFHTPTTRLFCGLNAGPCVELDRSTGATIRTCDTRSERAISIDVSADGRYLATLRYHGLCVVTDLETGQELWLKRFPEPSVGPRFTPDGQCVLTAAPARAPVLHLLSTTTGELLAELRGAKAEIAGIEVTTSGIAYAWDVSGTLTAWDLRTRALLGQYQLTS